MTLLEFQAVLSQIDRLEFIDGQGVSVPSHFHITEVGQLDRFFIDCGGTVRKTSKVNFQMYLDDDVEHRLDVRTLERIINDSITQLALNTSLELQIEYQGTSIESYGLNYAAGAFTLVPLKTDCLAKDKCGIPEKPGKKKVVLGQNTCVPGSGCC